MTGPELRALRLRLRMTQEELARAIGRHRNSINRWERERWPIGKMESMAIRALASSVSPRARRRRRKR